MPPVLRGGGQTCGPCRTISDGKRRIRLTALPWNGRRLGERSNSIDHSPPSLRSQWCGFEKIKTFSPGKTYCPSTHIVPYVRPSHRRITNVPVSATASVIRDLQYCGVTDGFGAVSLPARLSPVWPAAHQWT